MRFCVVGVGRMGTVHAENIADAEGLELAYLVDPDIGRARALADRIGGRADADVLDALADSSVDAVVIASATNTHVDFIVQAAQAGKAILCEKPIDLDTERVAACEAAIAGIDVPIMIGFQRRFDDTHRAVRQAISDGVVGAVESVSIISRDPSPPPAEYIKVSGGQFHDQMIHDFDLALWMTQETGTVTVYAAGAALIDPTIGDFGDTDSAHVLMQMGNGAFCKIECSRRAVYGYDQRVEVFGEHGLVSSANLEQTGLEVWTKSGTGGKDLLKPDFFQRYVRCYSAELKAFVETIERGESMSPSFGAGKRALQLAGAARQSFESGMQIAVELG